MSEVVRHYGIIDALVDDQAKVVTLKMAPRRREPLPPATVARCLSWALDRCGDLKRAGYKLDYSQVGERVS